MSSGLQTAVAWHLTDNWFYGGAQPDDLSLIFRLVDTQMTKKYSTAMCYVGACHTIGSKVVPGTQSSFRIIVLIVIHISTEGCSVCANNHSGPMQLTQLKVAHTRTHPPPLVVILFIISILFTQAQLRVPTILEDCPPERRDIVSGESAVDKHDGGAER